MFESRGNSRIGRKTSIDFAGRLWGSTLQGSRRHKPRRSPSRAAQVLPSRRMAANKECKSEDVARKNFRAEQKSLQGCLGQRNGFCNSVINLRPFGPMQAMLTQLCDQHRSTETTGIEVDRTALHNVFRSVGQLGAPAAEAWQQEGGGPCRTHASIAHRLAGHVAACKQRCNT